MTAMIKLSKKNEYLGRIDISGSAPAPRDAEVGDAPKPKTKKYHSMFG